jgi:tryptophan synthase beta subunit
LRTDDGTHESGIYVFSASTIGDTGTFVNADNEPTLDGTWQFVADLTTIDELTEYLSATHTTEFDQINNTEASYEVAIAGVKASLVPSILVTHTLANTVSVQAQVTGDNTVLLKVTNRSGVDIPASTQINILVKQ